MLESLYTGRRAHAFADALDEQWPGGTAREGNEPASDRPRRPATPGPPHEALPDGDGDRRYTDPAREPAGEPDEAPDGALLALTERLRALPPPPGLRPDTRAAQRAGLLAAMTGRGEEADAGGPPTERAALIPRQRAVHRPRPPLPPSYAATLFLRLGPRGRLSRGLVAGGLTLSVAVSAFSGAAAASGDALPGDALYGLKRGMEELRMDLATNDTDRGRLLLDRAARRLDEARALAARRPTQPPTHDRTVEEIHQALTSLRDDAEQGHRLLHPPRRGTSATEGRRQLATFAAEQRAVWKRLRGQLPAELHRVSADVTRLLDALEDGAPPGTATPSEAAGTGRGAPSPRRSVVPARPARPARPGPGPGPHSTP